MNRRAPGRSRFMVLLLWDGLRGSLQVLLTLFYRLRRFGAENVPREGPLLFVSNHQSHLDPVIVGILVHDRPFASLARSTLFQFKPFAWLIRVLGAVPLSRGASDFTAMKAALAELNAGRCVLVFPEGTRSPDGAVHRFRPGVRLLVRRSNALIVPVAVEGAYDVWPKSRRFPRLRGRLAVRAAPPVDPVPYRDDPDRLLEELREQIDEMRKGLFTTESQRTPRQH